MIKLTPEMEQALKELRALETGQPLADVVIKKVWVEARVRRWNAATNDYDPEEDLGIVSSSEPDEVTWKGDVNA